MRQRLSHLPFAGADHAEKEWALPVGGTTMGVLERHRPSMPIALHVRERVGRLEIALDEVAIQRHCMGEQLSGTTVVASAASDLRQCRAGLEPVRLERQTPLEGRHGTCEVPRLGILQAQPQLQSRVARVPSGQRFQLADRARCPCFG
jgi:hypothetical protein